MELLSFCLKVSSLGALLWLDRSHVFQCMISRPIVAGPLVGLFLGNPRDGLLAGVLFELLWACFLPVGTSAPPDDTVPAILTTAVGALGLHPPSYAVHADLVYGFILFLPTAYAGRKVDMALRTLNNRFDRLARSAAVQGKIKQTQWYNLGGLVPAYAAVFLLLFSSGILGFSIARTTFPLLPPFFLKTLHTLAYLVPLVGIGATLNSAGGGKTLGIWALSFLLFLLFLY